ncbi:MAG: PAS domain S-box protein, partial [Atribacterota bacterium]|nr:PAS domain S-box protein [Atribacterota bacterium]
RMDINGCITFFNEFAQKFFGYTEDEILGKNVVGTIVPEMDTSHRDLKATIKDIIKNPEKYTVNENENICRNGERAWVLWTNKGVFDKDGHISEILCIGNDITERKKAEGAILKSQQEFASLFKSSPEALVYLDKDSNIIDINPRFAELFGYTLEEIKGRNINDGMIHPPNKIKEGEDLDKIALSKGYFNYETIRKKKDGTLFPVSISGSNIVIDGQLKGIIGTYVDITERKQDEKLHQVLYNISKAANSPISLDELYQSIHKELSSIIDTTNFYIALVDEKENKIFFPYNIDNTKPIHLPRTINHNSLVAEVIRTGNSIFVNQEMIKGEKFMEEFKEWFGMLRKVWLGTPLKIEDKVIGAMVVQSYTNPELYSEGDIKLLEFVSSQVATAIERKRTEERIKHLSFHDSLTDLYNRAYFEEELERYNSPRYYPLSIMMVDINGLKAINDTFGHHEGDKLLQHFASLLNSISRKGDVVARLGGDEFAILLPSTTAEQVHDFHERIKKTCEEDNIKPIHLRPSIALGCVTQKGGYQNTETLLKEVDKRMYQDKNKTR